MEPINSEEPIQKIPPFNTITGYVMAINDIYMNYQESNGCDKLMLVENNQGNIVNFHISPSTYFLDGVKVKVGDLVTGFYDGNAPAIMIYPPQIHAVVIALPKQGEHVKVDLFNEEKISSDNMLKLKIAPSTEIILENGQDFSGNIGGRNLIVKYGATTRSIPAQTTPEKVVLMCLSNSSIY